MNRAHVTEALRRFWWIVLLFGIAGAALGAIPQPAATIDASTTYSATYTILIGTDDITSLNSNALVNQIKTFTQRGEVPQRAAVRLGQDETNGPGLAAQLSVEVDAASGAVTISTTQNTPDGAVDLVDAFGEELITFIAERQDLVLGQRLDKLLERQEALATEIEDLQVDLARKPDDALIMAKIEAASRQYSVVTEQYENLAADTTSITLTLLETGTAIENVSSGGLGAPSSRAGRSVLGLALGLVLGATIAALLGRLDRRLRTRSHAEAIFGGVVSAAIPEVSGETTGLAVMPERHDHLSDAYRTLRSVISFSQASMPMPAEGAPPKGRVTLVVSACAGDGKTAVAANLAAALAETGKRVVAVNADFRRPTLAKRLSTDPLPPLPLLLEDLASTPLRQLLQPTPVNGVVLLDLTSIVAPPGALARSTIRALPAVLAIAEAVVIDTSPVGITAEVLDLLPLADTIVVVMRLDHTLAGAARHTMQLLRTLSAGTIMLTLVGSTGDQSPYYEYGTANTPPKKSRRSRAGRDRDMFSGRLARASRPTLASVIVAAGLLYLVATSVAMQYTSYDTWGALIVAPFIAALVIAAVWRILDGDLRHLRTAAMVGLAAKLAGTLARYWVAFDAYGGAADSGAYHSVGRIIAGEVRSGTITPLQLLPHTPGTRSVGEFTAVIYTFFGSSRLAGFLWFAALGYLGVVLMVKAACIGVSDLSRGRYAWLCFLMPSIVFWPSSIGKEALMSLFLGTLSLGTARLLRNGVQMGTLLTIVAGGLGAMMVRPHLAAIWMTALVITLVWVSVAGRASELQRNRRVAYGAIAGIAVLSLIGISKVTLDLLSSPDDADASLSTQVSGIFDLTSTRSAGGGSQLEVVVISNPTDYPAAILRTLTRPLIHEATSVATLLPALEMTFFVIVALAGWRRLLSIPSQIRRHPFVLYSLLVTLMVGLAFANFANLAILVRQRSLVMPAMLLLICLPPWQNPDRRDTSLTADRRPALQPS